jgi:hypothetical protein
VGRHTLEKVSNVLNGRLREVRNLPQTARGKAGFTRISPTTIRVTKVGPSEPLIVSS